MAVSVSDLRDLAERIALNDDEPSYRASVSRAYYAAFHACHPLPSSTMFDMAIPPDTKAGMHEQVIKTLQAGRCGRDPDASMKLKSLGYVLMQLRQMRVESDYKLESSVGRNESDVAIQLTDKILEKVDELVARIDHKTA